MLIHEGGTYLKIDGPQFSTRAASRMYRQFADIIGMTCVPEAILCRELEMCCAVVATVTDYDVWADKPVSFDEIKKREYNLDIFWLKDKSLDSGVYEEPEVILQSIKESEKILEELEKITKVLRHGNYYEGE